MSATDKLVLGVVVSCALSLGAIAVLLLGLPDVNQSKFRRIGPYSDAGTFTRDIEYCAKFTSVGMSIKYQDTAEDFGWPFTMYEQEKIFSCASEIPNEYRIYPLGIALNGVVLSSVLIGAYKIFRKLRRTK